MNLFRVIGQTVTAVQWNGLNDAEVGDLLVDRPFPPIGWWVVASNGGVSVYSPDDFACNYEPLL